LRELYGQRGRQKVIEEYSWTNIAKKLNNFFLELVY
jgi:hypothetical protein